MLGGYLEFFMKPAVAEMYQCLRGELDELIQNKVSEAMKKLSLNVIEFHFSFCSFIFFF